MQGKLCGRSGAMLVPALWIYYYSIITGNIITPPTIGLFISYFIRGITLVRRDDNHFPTTQERLRSQSGNKEGTAYPFPRIRTHQKLQRKKSPSRDTSIAAASPSERFRSHRWMLPPVLPGMATPLHQVLSHGFRLWANASHPIPNHWQDIF